MLMLESRRSESAIGCGSCAKLVISWTRAVFEDLEVALAEAGDELAGAVLDRDAQENEIGAAVEDLLCGGRQDQRGPEAERDGETGHWPAQRVASTRTLGRFISTDSFVGGISDSGRE